MQLVRSAQFNPERARPHESEVRRITCMASACAKLAGHRELEGERELAVSFTSFRGLDELDDSEDRAHNNRSDDGQDHEQNEYLSKCKTQVSPSVREHG